MSDQPLSTINLTISKSSIPCTLVLPTMKWWACGRAAGAVPDSEPAVHARAKSASHEWLERGGLLSTHRLASILAQDKHTCPTTAESHPAAATIFARQPPLSHARRAGRAQPRSTCRTRASGQRRAYTRQDGIRRRVGPVRCLAVAVALMLLHVRRSWPPRPRLGFA